MITLTSESRDPQVLLAARYSEAFADYCQTGCEDALMAAYDLAREALQTGFTLADLGVIHHGALRSLLRGMSTQGTWVDRAEDFYLESVSVFDMAIKGYQTNVAVLKTEIAERVRIEEELRDVTFELARQRDELDQEVRQRTEELHQRAEWLEDINNQLQQANREQADFTYALSHDLKTPINTIDMFLNTLLEDYGDVLDEEALELITIATSTAERMRNLIDAVLEYSRIVEDDFRFETVDLNVIVQDAIRDATGTIREAGAEVRCHPLPAVMGSAFQLRMLLGNFLSNALRYRSSDRSARIDIKADTDPATGLAVISVQDNGIGMKDTHKDRIFTLFKRLHRFDEIKGYGVGLALCKRVAENHKSEIVVQSEFGKGSTFSVTLQLGPGWREA